jgi:hypothetical protein
LKDYSANDSADLDNELEANNVNQNCHLGSTDSCEMGENNRRTNNIQQIKLKPLIFRITTLGHGSNPAI